MKNKLKNCWFAFILVFAAFANAQEANTEMEYSLSLEEAIAFGLENNYNVQIAQKDIERALKQKWEIIAQGLPQLNAGVDYQNYLQQPVTLIPAELSGGQPGTYTPVRFGTKQSLNATGTWNQLIFDGSYIVGIQSAKTLLQISKNAKVKTDQEIKESIISAYGNVLLAEESVAILENNVANVEKTLSDTEKIYENGFAEEEDVERLEITLLNLQNNLNHSTRMRRIAYEMLNMALGIPVESNVTLTQDLDEIIVEYVDLGLLQKEIPVEENIDYKIAENNAQSAEIQVKLEKSKALPSISGFVNYGWQGFNENFNFFDKDQDYFAQSILGVSINIPIFSSGMRGARTQQRKIELEQALLELEQTSNQVKLEINSAKSDYEYSLKHYENQKRNLELAERIENKNQIKFFEGIATSFELSEAQSQLFAAQQDLLQAMLDVITTKASLENLLDTSEYKDN